MELILFEMYRRDRQAKIKLDKISEASSPSPMRQHHPEPQLNSRINAFSSTLYPTPKVSKMYSSQ